MPKCRLCPSRVKQAAQTKVSQRVGSLHGSESDNFQKHFRSDNADLALMTSVCTGWRYWLNTEGLQYVKKNNRRPPREFHLHKIQQILFGKLFIFRNSYVARLYFNQKIVFHDLHLFFLITHLRQTNWYP